MTTIADIQGKFIAKLENKYKGGINKMRLNKVFAETDKDNDGFISLAEFKEAITLSGNALAETEAEFLFAFWDTMAGQQEAQGAIEIALAVSDLLSTLPSYGGPFNSGAEGFKNKGTGKNNQPSQDGGIFGGGCYEADAAGVPLSSHRSGVGGGVAASQQQAPSSSPQRSQPKHSNAPSVPGGIFAAQDENFVAPPTSNRGSNKSNQSSIAGGIFGTNEPMAPPVQKKKYSNAPSIPGGIFG